jgi:hypothetical protein
MSRSTSRPVRYSRVRYSAFASRPRGRLKTPEFVSGHSPLSSKRPRRESTGPESCGMGIPGGFCGITPPGTRTVLGLSHAMITSRRYNVEPRPSLRSQGPRELSQRGSVGECHSATYDRARGSRRRGRPRFAGASLCIGGIRFGLGTFTMEVHEQAAPLSWSRIELGLLRLEHRTWRAPAGTEPDCEILG